MMTIRKQAYGGEVNAGEAGRQGAGAAETPPPVHVPVPCEITSRRDGAERIYTVTEVYIEPIFISHISSQ